MARAVVPVDEWSVLPQVLNSARTTPTTGLRDLLGPACATERTVVAPVGAVLLWSSVAVLVCTGWY
eukprot:36696-Rhodomonas_salina.1